ncbi:MAG: DUF899 domain-containing protein, partial [Myxococcales bacterium]|nr:DUF899 domain-containing protein [Myxococcales bacterium]
PWVAVEADYRFETAEGPASLAELFAGRSQLIVQHFMFALDWEQGCPSCSFWADGYDGTTVHLAARDIAFVAVSRAPLAKLQAYAKRMGWGFRWVSSGTSGFDRDFGVQFEADDVAAGPVDYNYGKNRFPTTDAPGISVFVKDEQGRVFHSYSCYARGLDMMNVAYQYMDLTPRGRDEQGLSYSMAWLRRHDQYEG